MSRGSFVTMYFHVSNGIIVHTNGCQLPMEDLAYQKRGSIFMSHYILLPNDMIFLCRVNKFCLKNFEYQLGKQTNKQKQNKEHWS